MVKIVLYVLPHRFQPSFLPLFGLDHHRAFPPKTYVWGSVFDPCSQAISDGLTVRHAALSILSARIFAMVQNVPYVLPHRFPPSFVFLFQLDHHRAFPPKT
jgi:hypothetical protein